MGISVVPPILIRPRGELTHIMTSPQTNSPQRHSEQATTSGETYSVKSLLCFATLLLAVLQTTLVHAEPPTGTLSGRITYAGPAVSDQVFEVNRDSAFCGAQTSIRTVAIHPKTRGLEGAVVSIDGDALPVSNAAPTPLMLTNTRCTFSPRVAAGIVGQQVEIRNDDPVMHNTHISLGPRTFVNVAMIPASRPVGKPLKQPGIYTVKCDAHKFMQAHVLAFAHPYFSVTDETGAFRIPDLPAGEHHVTIWHDTLGTIDQTVTISAQGHTSMTLDYHAAARKP